MSCETIPGSRRVPRSRPARLGVIGAGLVAQVAHLPILRDRDDLFVLAGLAEPDAAVRRGVAARYGIPRATAGHGELLAIRGEEADLDAVLVASPNHVHAEQVLDALDAGLHVLVEKPLCLAAEDARRIVGARDRTGLVVQVGYMKRYDPAVEALLERLGGAEIVHVESVTHDPGLREHFGPERGGAADRRVDPWSDVLLGALVHDVNLVRGVLDRAGATPVRVADGFAGGERAGGTIVLGNGARWTAAWLAVPSVADFAERITVFTTDGVHRLEFPAPYLLGAPTVYTYARGHERRAFTAWDEAYERSLRHFRACVAGEEPCRTPPEQAAADLELLAGLWSAAKPQREAGAEVLA